MALTQRSTEDLCERFQVCLPYRGLAVWHVGVGVTKSFTPSDRVRLKLMMDLFNVFNTSNILTYASGNVSQANSTAPASIIPPRVCDWVESIF